MTTTKTTKKTTTKKTEKKEKKIIPKHSYAVENTEYRKYIVKSVEGKATSVRDENGKKINRLHTVKYLENKKPVVKTLQIIYGRQLLEHKQKNITEVKNSKGSVYYFIPPAS